jgi:hypothetical protein
VIRTSDAGALWTACVCRHSLHFLRNACATYAVQEHSRQHPDILLSVEFTGSDLAVVVQCWLRCGDVCVCCVG